MANAPTLLSLFSACVLSISIVYDYGYFKYLGFDFSEAPVTFSDHIQSALIWIPVVAFFAIPFFIGLLAGISITVFSKAKSDIVKDEEKTTKILLPKLRGWFLYATFFLIVTCIPALNYYYIDFPIFSWVFIMIPVVYVMKHWVFSRLHNASLFYTVLIFPIFVIAVGILGAANAQMSTASPIMKYIANYYTLDIESKTKDVILLRVFDEYFLVWHPKEKNHEFIMASRIKSFVKKEADEK